MGSPDRHVTMFHVHSRRLLQMYSPGHVWVRGNDRADGPAGKVAITSSLRLGRSEVLRSLKHYKRAESQGHHTIDRLKERGVERGRAGQASLKGREKAVLSQTNTGTVSEATLKKRIFRNRVECIWAFPGELISSWIKLIWTVTGTRNLCICVSTGL